MDPVDEIYALAGFEAPDLVAPVVDDLAIGAPLEQLAVGGPVLDDLAVGAPVVDHLAVGGPVVSPHAVGAPVLAPKMARANNEGSFSVNPTGSVGPIPATPCRPAGRSLSWTPKFLSKISDADLKNRFLVKVSFENLHGAPINAIIRVVCGGNTIEDVCETVFSKLLKDGKIIPDQRLSAVFYTVEEKPLIVPAGTLMAAIFQTNISENGTSVELQCSIVDQSPGQPFVICAPAHLSNSACPIMTEGESSSASEVYNEVGANEDTNQGASGVSSDLSN